MRRSRLALVIALAFVVSSVLAACGSQTASAPTSTSVTTTPTTTGGASGPPTSLTIYRVENGIVVPRTLQVPHTEAVATASVNALSPGAVVTIAGGTATVDLPQAPPAVVAEIVYTLTQFPTIDRVDVAGQTGLTRADVSGYAPIILIDAPAADGDVPRTIRVSGSAVVFEATLVVELVRDGKVIDTKNVTASAGAPERGTFETTLQAPSPGPASVVAFAPSAEDGSPQHQVTVPVTVGP